MSQITKFCVPLTKTGELKGGRTDLNLASTFTLSYLGDAWYELWCRRFVIQQTQNSALVHAQVVNLVRCQTQSALSQKILPLLTQEECDVFQRGKNHRHLSAPKHATKKDYRAATGFECLVGYWYLTHQIERFETLFQLDLIQDYLKSLYSTTLTKVDVF